MFKNLLFGHELFFGRNVVSYQALWPVTPM